MKAKAIVCATIVVVSVGVLPASLRADSLPATPASPDSPGLIVDPGITRADPAITWDPAIHQYRMFTTETLGAYVPEWQAGHVTGPWRYVGDALPALPGWRGRAFTTWAPEVQDVNGVWTLWASTADANGNLCLFRATAQSAAGPYTVDPRRVPCDASVNGDIDPSMVFASGQWWLLFKTNANAYNRPPTFYSQRIGPDGMPVGPRYVLLVGDQPWEKGMIEAENLVQDRSTGQWWVTFSAGRTDPADSSYEIYTAPCDGPTGPCYYSGAVKLIGRNAQGEAPGEGNTFVAPDGQAWIAYNPGGYFTTPIDRPLALVKLDFDDEGEPYVVTPALPGF